MTKKGYQAYLMYLALQRHFSTSYDFFKYNGKVNASVAAYEKRNDMFSFEKLTKIIPEENLMDFFIAHFVQNPKMWIREMSKQTYENWKAELRLFPSTFEEDMYIIKGYDPKDLMDCSKDIPLIHKLAIEKKISILTLIVMDNFFPFIDKHKETVKVPFVFPDHIQMLIKYRPFILNKLENLDILKDNMKRILLDE